jgi:hypothetical protein
MHNFKTSITVQKFITLLSTVHNLNFRRSHVRHVSVIHAWERTSRWVGTISVSFFEGPGFKSHLWGQLFWLRIVVLCLSHSRQIPKSIYRLSNSPFTDHHTADPDRSTVTFTAQMISCKSDHTLPLLSCLFPPEITRRGPWRDANKRTLSSPWRCSCSSVLGCGKGGGRATWKKPK